MFLNIKSIILSWLYGQPIKPSSNLKKGDEVLTIESKERKYPVPCNMCNMILQDERISFASLEDGGLIFFDIDSDDGKEKMHQKYHLPSCPNVNRVMSSKSFMGLS